MKTIEYLFVNTAREKGLEFSQEIGNNVPDVFKRRSRQTFTGINKFNW